MKRTYVLICSGLIAFLIFPSAFWMLEPENPPLQNTGAPGETTCEQEDCHGGGSFTGISVLSGIPDTIEPSTEYTLSITLTSDCENAGFQLTALEGDNTKAGTLSIGTGTNVASFAGRQYIRQSSPRLLTGGSASWTFTWTSPAEAVDNEVTFYFAMINGNNDEKEEGDNVLINSQTVAMRAPVVNGIDVPSAPVISVYPNPVSDQITISGMHTGSTVLIYSSTGRLVKREQVAGIVARIQLGDLPSGTYQVVAESKNGRSIQQISKL